MNVSGQYLPPVFLTGVAGQFFPSGNISSGFTVPRVVRCILARDRISFESWLHLRDKTEESVQFPGGTEDTFVDCPSDLKNACTLVFLDGCQEHPRFAEVFGKIRKARRITAEFELPSDAGFPSW